MNKFKLGEYIICRDSSDAKRWFKNLQKNGYDGVIDASTHQLVIRITEVPDERSEN